MTDQPGLRREDMPLIQRAATANSQQAQRRFLRETSLNLTMLVIAAVAGGFTLRRGEVDWAGVIAAVAFFIAVFTRLDLLTGRPERIWYEGRAAAESAKTLAWRYAVGGEPFGIGTSSADEADALLLRRLGEILTDLRGLHLVPPTEGGEQITPRMRALRTRPLPERTAAYASGRITAQRDWYAAKARWNRNRAQRWGVGLLGIELLGAAGAILKAADVLNVDLLGFAGAAAAAGTSWLQAKQHATLAESYSVTAHELAAVAARVQAPLTEEAWARFVDQSEEAISREHTLWRASRVEERHARAASNFAVRKDD